MSKRNGEDGELSTRDARRDLGAELFKTVRIAAECLSSFRGALPCSFAAMGRSYGGLCQGA